MGEKRWPKWSYFTTLNNWIHLGGGWTRRFFYHRTWKVWIHFFAKWDGEKSPTNMAIGMVSLGKVWTFKCWRGQCLTKKGLVGFNDVRYRWICCIYAYFMNIIYIYYTWWQLGRHLPSTGKYLKLLLVRFPTPRCHADGCLSAVEHSLVIMITCLMSRNGASWCRI